LRQGRAGRSGAKRTNRSVYNTRRRSRQLEREGPSAGGRSGGASRILFALLSFDTFDTLAGPERSLEEEVPEIQRLALALIERGG